MFMHALLTYWSGKQKIYSTKSVEHAGGEMNLVLLQMTQRHLPLVEMLQMTCTLSKCSQLQ